MTVPRPTPPGTRAPTADRTRRTRLGPLIGGYQGAEPSVPAARGRPIRRGEEMPGCDAGQGDRTKRAAPLRAVR